MEPVEITPAFIQAMSALPSATRQVLHRNRGRYVGAEWTERGWVIPSASLLLADSPAQWQALHGANR